MKIKNVHFVPGQSSFYFDDQAAIKAGAIKDGFIYEGSTATDGFMNVRQPGESICILMEMENGQLAEGDCAAVQYSGAAGRDPLFSAKELIPILEEHVKPILLGYDVKNFREATTFFDTLKIRGSKLHTAVRYGLSQALLAAAAISKNKLKFEVVCEEWSLPKDVSPLPLFGQSGDERYTAVDKMILRKVDALPHGLINNIAEKVGDDGNKLIDYVSWVSNRIQHLSKGENYNPAIHIDVYGTIGMLYNNDPEKVAGFLRVMERNAKPFECFVEGPVDAGSHDAQISLLRQIKRVLKERRSSVQIVADEWCNTFEDVVSFVDAECCDMIQIKTPDLGSLHNTIDAILYCKEHHVSSYLGGTCNETDVSARACLHVALATRPDRVLVKPGMGFDEGMTIVANEMNRTIAHAQARCAA